MIGSEEDEKMLCRVIDSMKFYLADAISNENKEVERLVKEEIDWLKSLKTQRHWEPTEEQIEIIDMILTNESMDDNVARILRELKEQLEKLQKEE